MDKSIVEPPRELLRVDNLRKSFPGVKALNGVQFRLRAGEVHALVGENGAGKSTLIKCLMGVYRKDSGTITLEGKPLAISHPARALQAGLGAVYQDVMLARHLSVAENFFLGNLPLTKVGTVDWPRAHRESAAALRALNIDVSSRALLEDLSIAKQEMVAIAKIYSHNCKVVIFDEPTALLSTEETEILFSLIARLKGEGMGVIYVSHRMEEIYRISDRITIFKDGSYVDTLPTADTDENDVIERMVGRKISDMYGIRKGTPGESALQVEGLSRRGRFRNISFDVREGEIFGMFGLVGSGRSEVVESIYGVAPYDRGTVIYQGKALKKKSPSASIRAKIGFLTEDRKETGLYMELPCMNNINALSYRRLSRFGVINGRSARRNADSYKERLRIKAPSVKALARNLSGGNQQKVVLAKWLSISSKLLIFDEPTVGVDVGAKGEIYKLLETMLEEKKAVILISSYLPEVMGLADRILVMHEGEPMAIVDKKEFSSGKSDDEERFIRLASGIREETREEETPWM